MSAAEAPPLCALELRADADVVAARQRAREVAERLGLDGQDQVRFATAVSEVARNAVRYARDGRIEFDVRGAPGDQLLVARVSDSGPGIPHVAEVLDGCYVSRTGMGMGLAGTRRLMDVFDVRTAPGQGTVVELGKRLPRGASLDAAERERVAAELARLRPGDPVHELQRQNAELAAALAEVRARQEDLSRLSQELEDTNRGVVALYAELDERMEQLRRANKLRAQFMSYMGHEFRTPLDSILALSRLLLEHVDGPLGSEQEKQVSFIRRSAQDLLGLVDDLLDTARVEAGKAAVRPSEFTAAELFNALRATLRPLLAGESTRLWFDDAAGVPPLRTDEPKVAQILRNLVSNALKFTEAGEVRVSARAAPGDRIVFVVADTGVGIAAEDQRRIFEDFAQVDGHVQRRRRGTGLGLSLSRKLAELLGGTLAVQSEPGRGSVFTVELPREYHEPAGRSGGGEGDDEPA
ncbi:MAG: ATP-binding protein [Gemmatimonadetes bacterium]|nr:ATP-binding protein [Gemmatimonadota bacterium]